MTNASLIKKTAARITAVQCLYTNAVNASAPAPDTQVAALKKRLGSNKAEQKLVLGGVGEPSYTLLAAILAGVAEHRDAIDRKLESALREDWKRERLGPVLAAILQCAIFELFFHKDIAPKIAVGEYTRLARNFTTDAEADFVHAALIALVAKQHG